MIRVPSRHLARILEGVRQDLAVRKAAVALSEVASLARACPRRLSLGESVARTGRPGILAEIKRASPSRGWIREALDVPATARAYRGAGACGVSVLTEGREFGGSLGDLGAVSSACPDLPVLRKDFLLDEYMMAEARAHGADAALVIVAIHGEATAEIVRAAREYGLEPLVEVHDEEELETAVRSGATVVGINNRDLATLAVDRAVSERLLPRIPGGILRIVESGISTAEQVRRLHEMGADAFLVGEALMRFPDPGDGVRMLKGVPH